MITLATIAFAAECVCLAVAIYFARKENRHDPTN